MLNIACPEVFKTLNAPVTERMAVEPGLLVSPEAVFEAHKGCCPL